MADSRDNDVSAEWISAIGRYISSFAYVELLVYELFELLPKDSVSRSHKNLRDFSNRARLLQALIRSTDWARKADLEKIIEDLLPHGLLRNNLAHNPLFIDIYMDGDNFVEIARLVQAKNRTAMNHINLGQLKRRGRELATLTEALVFQVGSIKERQRDA